MGAMPGLPRRRAELGCVEPDGGWNRYLSMRRAGAFVALLAGTLLGAVLMAPSASAHATLSSSDPADGARLDEVPERVVLTFSEAVGLANGFVRVTDEADAQVDDGSPVADGGRVSVGLRDDLPDGSYLISYRLTSSDSHPIGGALAFVVGDGALLDPEDGAAGANGSTGDPVVNAVFSIVRWLSYAGLVLLVGPLVISGLCWAATRTVPALFRLFGLGAGLSIGTALLSVVLQALYVSGAPLTRVLSADVPAALGTRYGTGMLVRVALVAILVMSIRWAVLTRPAIGDDATFGVRPPAEFWAAAVPLVAIALTFSAAGHAVASSTPALSIVSDCVHVLAMSIWLGGLVALVVVLPQRDTAVLSRVLPRLSTVALVCVGALLVSGSVMAVLEIAPLAALWSTTYGLLVTLKVIGFAILVTLGKVARTRVRARYAASTKAADARPLTQDPFDEPDDPDRDPDLGPRGLRRSLLLEAGVAAIVLVLAAVLVATVPARAAYTAPFAESIALPEGGSVEVTVQPARSGPNLVHIYLFDEAGQPWEVREVTAVAELSAQQIGPLDIPLEPAGAGHYVASGVAFPTAGLWELTISVRLGEFDASTVRAEVPVA